MPTLQEIENALYELAPRNLAQEWDNVGLLVGRPEQEVHRVLVALDVTEAVAEEAAARGAELIAAHHPVIFRPVKSLTDRDAAGRTLLRLAADGVAAICMHTNLDAAQGGVNDALAARLGLTHAEPLPGGDGILRMGGLPGEMALPAFLRWVREALGPNGIRFADGGRPIRRVAVGGGACGEYIRAAREAGCDALVTADVKYNQFLDAQAAGLTVIDAGHFPTEDVVCPVLVRYLAGRFPGLLVEKSASHREVIQFYV